MKNVNTFARKYQNQRKNTHDVDIKPHETNDTNAAF